MDNHQEQLLDELNHNPLYDNTNTLNNLLHSDDNTNTFTHINLNSDYYDIFSFRNKLKNTANPIFLSINIQSIQSKYEELKSFVTNLQNQNVFIDVIALQETWNVQYKDLLQLPGYNLLESKERLVRRGGGVGFYVRTGIKNKTLNNFSQFIPNVFENISIELTYPRKKNYS
jgi:hypothetical protein